jgi:hypothetical protein
MLTDGSRLSALASRIVGAAVVGGAMCGGGAPAFAYDRLTAQMPRLLNRDRRRSNSSPLGVYRRVHRAF